MGGKRYINTVAIFCGKERIMNFEIEFERETDGRRLAEIQEVPGVGNAAANRSERESAGVARFSRQDYRPPHTYYS